MASLLHRLGAFSARRPFAVLLAWVFVLAAAVGGMASLSRPLSNEFEIPHSEFGRVLDELGQEIPQVAGGTGTVVVHSPDGFTADQRRALRDTMTEWEDLPHVTAVLDPFKLQRQLDGSGDQLDRGLRKLTKGQEQYDEGRAQLIGLENWLADHPDDATPALEQQLADGKAQLADAGEQLDSGWATYHAGKTLSDAGDGVSFVSDDGTTALVQVRFDSQTQQLDPAVLERVPETGAALADAGIRADYGQEMTASREVGGPGEVIGVAVAGVVLLVMLGSLVLAGLPLAIALVGVGVSLTLGIATTQWISLQSMAPVLGMMLGLAVGIDYALFIVNRHRHQLAALADESDEPLDEERIRASIALATGTAGSAVVVAGTTVVIALAALAVSGIPTLLQMGMLAAFTVAVTVIVALTLTPALLSLAGRRAIPRRRRTTRSGRARDGWPQRWVGLVTRRPRAATALVTLVMLVLAVPALSMRLGLPDGSSEPQDSTAYRAYERVADDFGPGANGPLLLAAEYDAPVAEADVVAAEAKVARAVLAVDDRVSVLPIGTSDDRRTIAFQVVPAEGPSAESTVELVQGLRRLAAGDEPVHQTSSWLGLQDVIADADPTGDELLGDGVSLGLTGATVANIEVSERLAAALPLYLTMVIGLSLVLLTIVFRSILVPLVATAGFLLSVAASFGAIVAVYQWGWLGALFDVHDPSAVFSFMPTLLIGILFGLAMDYQMFLVSGMHESYVHGKDARTAVRAGFASGARVVAAAALIMVSVFSGFIWAEMTMARSIGFGLAVGVLLDAFLVRMTFTPAVLSLLGDKAWWLPGWLDRLLPNLDVEGAALAQRLERERTESEAPAEEPARELTPVS
ncbi:MMPL family transporter [Nocardioides oleivorans]|uniref:MMPL family transporter n=1 Tax=Nocardioides oleivorans TaxID=273676 RepID=A0A4Q2RUF2_9ACTN|nr:MMPL family transporter [Nocardioides oleivorans]RYB91073.1 MMPL family transporter [Nocardioides oleivorans]